MSAETIHETCGCGARFDWRGDSAFTKGRAADFRANHRHIEHSVGMCGDRLHVGDPTPRTNPCVLRAGHAGFHEDGEGCSWGRPTWTTGVSS